MPGYARSSAGFGGLAIASTFKPPNTRVNSPGAELDGMLAGPGAVGGASGVIGGDSTPEFAELTSTGGGDLTGSDAKKARVKVPGCPASALDSDRPNSLSNSSCFSLPAANLNLENFCVPASGHRWHVSKTEGALRCRLCG